MRASAAIKLAALLILALLAPLQNVFAAACTSAPQATQAPCPDHQGHDPGGVAHACGCCSVVAFNTLALGFEVPRERAPPLTLPAPGVPREPARDRLDRPPR